MPSYLVELYLPRARAEEARTAGDRARAAAAELSAGGVPVQYVRTTYQPEDETCFHVFVAESAEAVDEVCRRAALVHGRIAIAVETADQNASSRRTASTPHSGDGM
jgi:hypothetical protein